jgi:hypothetical protein
LHSPKITSVVHSSSKLHAQPLTLLCPFIAAEEHGGRRRARAVPAKHASVAHTRKQQQQQRVQGMPPAALDDGCCSYTSNLQQRA